jgi:hypothetical protein
MEWYEDEVRWLERTRNLGLVDPPPVAVYSGSSLWGGRPCCPRPRSPSYFIVDLYISKWPSPGAGAQRRRRASISAVAIGWKPQATARFWRRTARESMPLTVVATGRLMA